MTPDQLAQILDDLGKRLGPTGQHVFELAVRQVYINAGVATVMVLATAIVGIVALPRLMRWQQLDQSSTGDRGIVVMILGFLYGALGLIVLVFAFFTIPSVLNPEYAALRDILSAIGGAK